MTLHYPLNGIDLDFDRYEHRPLGARDIMANRLMEHYMVPRPLRRQLDESPSDYFLPIRMELEHRKLSLDMRVLSKTLRTNHNWPFTAEELRSLCTQPGGIFKRLFEDPAFFFMRKDYTEAYMKSGSDTGRRKIILGLIERHFLESDPSVRIWLKLFQRNCSKTVSKHTPGWKKDMVEHLKSLQLASEAQYCFAVYSGGHYLSIDAPPNVQFSIPCFIGPSWFRMWKLQLRSNPARKARAVEKSVWTFPLSYITCIDRGRPRRSNSVPASDSWATAAIVGLDGSFREEKKWVIYFPRRPLSELDKMSRRRSLSRTHIRAMFTDKPKWTYRESARKQASQAIKHPCANCAQYTHRTKFCPAPCGYCNASSHIASACTVKASNRCKCQPFPQFHTAFECYIRCSRRCGCPHHPGHFKHKNAMLCSYRCCMCGAKGHSGRKCSLKKCPCGEQHLTQDCRWKVECSAKGCNLYLCHLHCRECGRKKDKSNKNHFVGRTCQDCLKNGRPVLGKAG
ncbi:hypothetical protein F5Y05DRAFT_369459 [Hypoxylon sp. FL0543]|nr:hypothetical protein F5Y05DRAFT_369459 [Hypoxylon sp. FL0543]